MLSRIRRGTFAAPILLLLSTAAHAAQPFDARAFQQAQAAGEAILVDVSATWCPTCKAQQPIVQEIQQRHPRLIVFDVEFDSAKNVLKQFHVQYQSTLILFKGSKEIARSTGDTDPVRIENLVAKGF